MFAPRKHDQGHLFSGYSPIVSVGCGGGNRVVTLAFNRYHACNNVY